MTTHYSLSRFLVAGQRGVLALCVAVCWLLAPLSEAAPEHDGEEHHIITFQAPGADTTAGDFNGTFAAGINNWGAITGSYTDKNNVNHGFIRISDDKFITFQAPGADTTPGSFNGTTASSINDFGAVTGDYFDVNGFSHGYLRSREGKFTTFDVPGVGGFGTTPLALNLEGAIVGYYSDANFAIHAFLRRPDGTFTAWDGPGDCENSNLTGCFGSGASNINFFGLAVGGYEDNKGNFAHHGLVRSPEGKLTVFNVPGAGTGSYQGTGCPGCASGLNQKGAIAGIYIDSNNVQHGYLRNREGEFTTFDAPGAGTGAQQGTGCPSDCPTSLNDRGQITGVYIDANFGLHGYLRNHEGKIVTIDPAGSAGLTAPFGINDFGAVTGYYLDANNVFHSFLRIPDR